MSKGSKWSKSERNGRYSGAFVGKLGEMLESPAYRVLSLAAHRVLARIEIELINHGGHENSRLIVTFRQFEEYGVRKHNIAAGIRELEALGFIEITEHGCAGNAGYGQPNKFRLTYRPALGAPADGSHEWRRIKTMEDALHTQKRALKPPSENVARRGGRRVQKTKPQPTNRSNSPHESHQIHPTNRGVKAPLSHTTNRGALSRSGSGPSAAGPATGPASKPPPAATATAGRATAASQPSQQAKRDPWTPTPP
jgi:hypothetical protein